MENIVLKVAGQERTGQESTSEMLHRLQTSECGISAQEAEKRFRELGPNEFVTIRLKSKIIKFIKNSTNPIIAILIVAIIVSVILGARTDATIIGCIVMMSIFINFIQTYRSERAVKQLQNKIAHSATVCRNGQWIELPRRQIVQGDIIRLSSGDLVPADGRLIETDDLHVQQGALTGESLPVKKFVIPEKISTCSPESAGLVFLGTSIVSGTAKAVIFATGKKTAFGDIVERLSESPLDTEFDRGMKKFSQLVLQTIIFLVLFILIANIGLGRDPLQSLLFSVALAVGLTPEFLPVITTVTLAQGALRMAKEKVIVKHLSSIQNLGCIDILCSDKTGTLTKGTMAFDSSLDPSGIPFERALFYAHLNSKFETGIKSPLDSAILERPIDGIEGYVKTDEIPFDFDRRRLSVVVEKDQAFILVTKGAPESVIDVCSTYELENNIWDLNASIKLHLIEKFHSLSDQGFRVLAVAYASVPNDNGYRVEDERDLTFVGFITFSDHLLDGLNQSIEALRKDGVKIKILTGDNEYVTRFICKQVGIESEKIILGTEIELMSEMALARVAEKYNIFARVSPTQKHRIINALKANNHVVGFLGDGINDAPSLHSADVGISVAGAVDVAREASDIILLERRLDVLHSGILAGRRAFGNVFKYLLMGISSNFGNMFSMTIAALFLPFLPMLPTQILLNNFLYDIAQIAIPTDNIDPHYIRKPQRWDIHLVRNFMLIAGPVSSIFDIITFIVFLYVFHFSERSFHTGWFLESLTTQTLVLFIIRTVKRPWTNLPSIPLLITTIFVVLVGMALPYSALASFFGFNPLEKDFFLFLFLVTSMYLVIVEIIKGKILSRI